MANAGCTIDTAGGDGPQTGFVSAENGAGGVETEVDPDDDGDGATVLAGGDCDDWDSDCPARHSGFAVRRD